MYAVDNSRMNPFKDVGNDGDQVALASISNHAQDPLQGIGVRWQE